MKQLFTQTSINIALAVALACIVPTVACADGATTFFQPLVPPRDFQVMVSGGAGGIAPANTRPAIVAAIEDSIEWVEVPVRKTKDGKHVLFASDRLEGRSSGQGLVADHTLAELKELDCGNWFAKRFAGAKILTLGEVLALAKGKVNLCLDCRAVEPAQLAREVADADAWSQVLVTASSPVLRELRGASDGRLALLLMWQPSDEWQVLDELRPAAVDVGAETLDADLCGMLHDRGIKVRCRTVDQENTPAAWDRALAAGADYLLSETPEEVVAQVIAKRLTRRPVRFTCHRGASRYAPENTLAAFEKAYRLGADFVEFDVRPSRDGEYFLLHDSKLDRTTSGKGQIRDATSQQIRGLDAGNWFAPSGARAHVPSLEEFLSSVPAAVSLYFDAKDISPADLAAALAKHNLVERTVVYQSARYLADLKQIDARIRRMPPSGSIADVDRLAAEVTPFALDTRWTALSREYIEHCHARGIQVFADAPFGLPVEKYQQAIEWGIDCIQTDYPLRVWRAMELVAAARQAQQPGAAQ